MREKTTFVKIGLILLSLSLIFSLTACPNGDDARGTGAEITGVTVAGFDAVLPEPIPAEVWELGLGGLPTAQTGDVFLTVADYLTDAEIRVEGLSPGAIARFAIAQGTTRPIDFSTDNVITLNHGPTHFLYIEVTSEDGRTVNYYRIRVQLMNANAVLTRVSIVVGGQTINAVLASPNALWAEVTAGTVTLPSSMGEGASLEVITQNPLATVEMAHIPSPGTGAPVWTAFNDAATFDIEDETVFGFRVTAQNGVTINYYKIVIEQGRVATLSALVIGGEGGGEIDLGTPVTEWNTPFLDRGVFQSHLSMTAAGFTVAATPTDSGATVTWYYGDGTPDWGTESPIVFATDDSSVLYVRVVSANGLVRNYYAIEIKQFASALVFYGRPVINPDPAARYVDDLWYCPDLDHHVFNVSRINVAEGPGPAWWATTPHTSATARIMWDDEGLYVYWNVNFYDFVNAAGPQTRTITTDGVDLWLVDSVELFLNERLQARPAGNHGLQYRVGAATNVRSGQFNAGMGSPPVPQSIENAWMSDAAQQQNLSVTWEKEDGSGYIVIMHVPWVWAGHAEANLVFDADRRVIPEATIGLEMQLNASSAPGTRDAILTWNGIHTQAFAGVGGFGNITLNLQAGADRITRAATPNVTASQLASVTYEENSTTVVPLSVTATVLEGNLTYQWYSADTADGLGAPVLGATSYTFTPLVANANIGDTWYWVVITNTNLSASPGYTTATFTSARARIRVLEYGTFVDPVVFDLARLSEAEALEFFAGRNNRGIVSFDNGAIIFDRVSEGTGGTGMVHDSEGGGWAALTVMRPNMLDVSAGDTLRIQGTISAPTMGGAGRLGFRLGSASGNDYRILLTGGGNNLPATFDQSIVLTPADVEDYLELVFNLWGLNPPTGFVFTITDLTITMPD